MRQVLCFYTKKSCVFIYLLDDCLTGVQLEALIQNNVGFRCYIMLRRQEIRFVPNEGRYGRIRMT